MPSANPKYLISTLTVDSVTWTPIIPPFPCNFISIKCGTQLLIRTDSADVNTQDTIPVGMSEAVVATSNLDSSGHSRFPSAQTIAFLQAASGTPSVTLRFVR